MPPAGKQVACLPAWPTTSYLYLYLYLSWQHVPPQAEDQWETVVSWPHLPCMPCWACAGKMALENSPGPDGAYRWQSKAANKMIMGLRNGPEHGRKCKQSEPLTGLSRPLSAAQICKKSQAHIQIAATICQHGKTKREKRANHLIELSKSSSRTKDQSRQCLPAPTPLRICRRRHRRWQFGTHWPRNGIAMKNLVYYKLAKIFQLICPETKVRIGLRR